MTPLKVKQRQQSLTTSLVTKVATGTATSQTLFDFSTATGNVIEISGTYGEVNTSSNQTIYLNGTGVSGTSQNNLSLTDYDFRYVTTGKGSYYFRFDMTSNSFIGFFSARTSGTTTVSDYVVGRFTTLTTLSTTLRGSASNSTYVTATITQNY